MSLFIIYVDTLCVLGVDWGLEGTKSDDMKRDLKVTDRTKVNLILTLWRGQAEAFEGKQGMVYAVRNAIVGEFGGKVSLSSRASTLLWVRLYLIYCYQ